MNYLLNYLLTYLLPHSLHGAGYYLKAVTQKISYFSVIFLLL